MTNFLENYLFCAHLIQKHRFEIQPLGQICLKTWRRWAEVLRPLLAYVLLMGKWHKVAVGLGEVKSLLNVLPAEKTKELRHPKIVPHLREKISNLSNVLIFDFFISRKKPLLSESISNSSCHSVCFDKISARCNSNKFEVFWVIRCFWKLRPSLRSNNQIVFHIRKNTRIFFLSRSGKKFLVTKSPGQIQPRRDPRVEKFSPCDPIISTGKGKNERTF